MFCDVKLSINLFIKMTFEFILNKFVLRIQVLEIQVN